MLRRFLVEGETDRRALATAWPSSTTHWPGARKTTLHGPLRCDEVLWPAPTSAQGKGGTCGVANFGRGRLAEAAASSGAERWRNRAEKKRRGRQRLRLKRVARKLKEATTKPSPRQRDAQTATRATGRRSKINDGELASAVTVHRNYRIAIRQNLQITPKIAW